MKNKKTNLTKILFFMTILALENFLYLVPGADYVINGFLKYSDIGVLMSFIFFIWVMFFIKSKDKKIEYKFKNIIIFLFVIIIISSCSANYFFNQPVFWGIRSHRFLIACFLMYFPMTKALKLNIMTKDTIIKTIYLICTLEMILFTLQFILVDKITFLHFIYDDVVEIRLSRRRLRFPFEMILLSSLLSLNNIMSNKGKKRIFDYVNILWFFVILTFIIQKRTNFIVYILTLIFGFLILKKNTVKKLLIGIFVFSIGYIVLINSSMFQATLDGINNRGSEMDTISIRERGMQYYINRLETSPFVGFGFPNAGCTEAVVASGKTYHYNLADNGIMGFFYVFGISGLVWLTIFWIKNYRYSFNIMKNSNYLFLLYFFYETIDLYLGMKWYYYWPVAISLVITLLEHEMYINKRLEIT